MDLEFTRDESDFRQEVREWLHANVPRTPRPPQGEESVAFDRAWQRQQFDGGWAGLSWPAEYGGRGLPLIHQLIWHEEYALAEAPSIGNLFVAVNHAGPTLIVSATEDQKSFHLPKILRGEAVWCQGFSEPGAGSDLAGVRMRGVVTGEHLVVSGQKIWTSYAQHAQYQELLVRTDSTSARHKSLTWIICEMSLPGIDVRPIRAMTGEFHCNEVFYDEVAIPLRNVVGAVNDGWRVAMSTLGFERGASLIARQIELSRTVDRLVGLARETRGRDGRPALDDGMVYHRLAVLRAEVAALRAMTYAAVSRGLRENVPGPEGSIISLYYGELSQRVCRTAMEVLGPRSLELSPPGGWTWDYLNSFKHTIAGGTSQIRRNVIGERLLGLPKGR